MIASGSEDNTVKLWDIEPEPAPATANTLPASLQQGLIAYYPFNGNANDESGNGNHGEVQGAIFAPDRLATPEKSIAFNNKGQAVVVRANNDLNSIPSDTHSICFWIRPSIDAIDKSRFAYLINRVKPGNIQWNYLWECSPDKSKPTGWVRASTNSVHVPGNQPTDFSVGFDRWNHVVFSTDASSTRVFIAGKIRGSYNPLVWPSIPSIDLRFGNYGDAQFIGSLDDIRIYNRPLSAAEVKSLYEYESKPPATPIPTAPATKSITNKIGMTLNVIPAGTFMMGSPVTEKDRESNETQHEVTISKAFYMQTTEVTQSQWTAVMGTEPWKGQGDVKEGPNYPASYVTWDDAVAYCEKLSEGEGKTYRLPTEAEWEYAFRAGTKTTWSFGDDEASLGDYAWHRENAYDIGELYAHQVGLKEPNAFGLYDMHGNVYEWCHDYFEEDYYKQSPAQDPPGPVTGSSRVLRGGSWDHNSRRTRSANRNRLVAGYRYHRYGFRLVRELD
jgi:sulfatase modifying factor 1